MQRRLREYRHELGSSLSGFLIRHEHGIGTIKLREQPLQVSNLRQVVDGDVRIGWFAGEKILMIPFGRVKRMTRLDLGPYSPFRIELKDHSRQHSRRQRW
jgi:hypothetical protein